MPDSSILKVQLVDKMMNSELQVLRNGQPLPGSSSDPQNRLKIAYGMIYFIAGLNILLGSLSFLFTSKLLQQLGAGSYMILYGFTFLTLGIFTQRKSSLALILAIIIFALDGILGIVFSVLGGSNPAFGGLVVRILLLIPMFNGVGAIKAIKAQREQSPNVIS